MEKREAGAADIREIAAQLGCSERTIRRWHADGKIPTYQLGGRTSPIKMSRIDLRRLTRKKGKP